MIKAIIFDFYGVICSDEYWQIVKRDRDVVSGFSKLADELHLGAISWDDFVREIAAKTGKPVAEINAAYESESINLSLVAYIAKLHKNYKTALLSNAAFEAFRSRAKEIGLDTIFDYTAVSSELGLIKPDLKIYQFVLDKLGVKASEAIYIDDILRYVEAANKMGIESIHYKDFSQMKAELEDLLTGSND